MLAGGGGTMFRRRQSSLWTGCVRLVETIIDIFGRWKHVFGSKLPHELRIGKSIHHGPLYFRKI